MTDLRTAALRALEALSCLEYGMCGITEGPSDDTTESAITALRAALAQPEDKSQAAFEHWVETVEATQGCAISRNAVADAVPIIQPEIKGHNAEPPPEAQTEAEKIAYCAGWWAAMEAKREQEPVAWIDNSEHPKHRLYRQSATEKRLYGPLRPLYAAPHNQWQGLTDDERDYFRACGFVGVSRVEEVLRAKNSTLACIPAVPPG